MEEIWKPIPWYEGLYEVSSFWRVKRLARVVKSGERWHQWKPEKIMKQHLSKNHYRICLMKDGKRDDCYVHRLMAATFLWGSIEFDKEHLVCHKNDVGTDNRLENLYIWNYSNNNTDTVRNWHWVDNSNENHGNCRLKNEDVIEIRRLVSQWIPQYKVAEMYWIDQSYVSRLKNDLNRRIV